MAKIRIGSGTGIDIAQVVGWKFSRNPDPGSGDCDLTVFFAGETLSISRDSVGEVAFTRLHELLLDVFAINLSPETE